MKLKLFCVALMTLFATTFVSAQNEFGKGDMALNINYGMGDFDVDDNVFQHSLGVSLEYGILDGIIKGKGTVAVGGQVGFGFGSKSEHGVDINCTRFRIATRGVFHYQFIPQLDTYAGITLGIVDIDKAELEGDFGDYEIEKLEEKETRFVGPVAFAGARYMFSDSFGLNVELSWDSFAMVGLGVTFKL